MLFPPESALPFPSLYKMQFHTLLHLYSLCSPGVTQTLILLPLLAEKSMYIGFHSFSKLEADGIKALSSKTLFFLLKWPLTTGFCMQQCHLQFLRVNCFTEMDGKRKKWTINWSKRGYGAIPSSKNAKLMPSGSIKRSCPTLISVLVPWPAHKHLNCGKGSLPFQIPLWRC